MPLANRVAAARCTNSKECEFSDHGYGMEVDAQPAVLSISETEISTHNNLSSSHKVVRKSKKHPVHSRLVSLYPV